MSELRYAFLVTRMVDEELITKWLDEGAVPSFMDGCTSFIFVQIVNAFVITVVIAAVRQTTQMQESLHIVLLGIESVNVVVTATSYDAVTYVDVILAMLLVFGVQVGLVIPSMLLRSSGYLF